MKTAKIIAVILSIAILLPVMASCSSGTDTSSGGTTVYTTLAAPTPVVITKTVKVPVPNPDPKVVVVPRPVAPNPPNHPLWHNWHWPWHHPHP